MKKDGITRRGLIALIGPLDWFELYKMWAPPFLVINGAKIALYDFLISLARICHCTPVIWCGKEAGQTDRLLHRLTVTGQVLKQASISPRLLCHNSNREWGKWLNRSTFFHSNWMQYWSLVTSHGYLCPKSIVHSMTMNGFVTVKSRLSDFPIVCPHT